MVYKEIVPGDLRKFSATSNDAQSGGGARDIRFPAKAFRPIMLEIFTNSSTQANGKTIHTASVSYLDKQQNLKTTNLTYWPATDSRPSEDRIAKVHSSPAIGGMPPAQDKGTVFLLLIKFDDNTIRCVYAYEDDLKEGKWSNEVCDQILSCQAASKSRRRNRTIMGYYDFSQGSGYCHGE